jgi:hypothetical protein
LSGDLGDVSLNGRGVALDGQSKPNGGDGEDGEEAGDLDHFRKECALKRLSLQVNDGPFYTSHWNVLFW